MSKPRSSSLSKLPNRRWPFIAGIACVALSLILFSSFLPKHSTLWSFFRPSQLQPPGDRHDDRFLLNPEAHVFREPETLHFDWEVTVEERRPDGVLRPVFLINGLFPGPTIEARPGDEIVVQVRNAVTHEDFIDQGVSIHWHGLSLNGANNMDGAVGITQRAIKSGDTHEYRFRIGDNEAGTYWYHGHSSVQRADGLYGALIVHDPARASNSDEGPLQERALLVGDWYHRTSEAVAAWFLDPNHYAYEPAPDSILFNGQGRYNCSMAVKAYPVDCVATSRPSVRLSGAKRSKLRVINTGASAGITISFLNARAKAVSVDGGGRVQEDTPFATSVGVLYPGERIDLIIERISLDESAVSEMTITLDHENMNLLNYALDDTQTFPISWEGALPTAQVSADETKHIEHTDLNTLNGTSPPVHVGLGKDPLETARLFTEMRISSLTSRPTGAFNHTSFVIANGSAAPMLELDRKNWGGALSSLLPTQQFDPPHFAATSPDEYVDLELHNFDDVGHPFHLHGHQFYVLARHRPAPSKPLDYMLPVPLNTGNPIRKDTVYVPGRGRVVVRLSPSNPGLWLLHCHVIWHQAAGMETLLEIGEGSRSGDNGPSG